MGVKVAALHLHAPAGPNPGNARRPSGAERMKAREGFFRGDPLTQEMARGMEGAGVAARSALLELGAEVGPAVPCLAWGGVDPKERSAVSGLTKRPRSSTGVRKQLVGPMSGHLEFGSAGEPYLGYLRQQRGAKK